MRGLVRMELHQDSEAEADFQRSLTLDAGSSDAHNNYGWFLCQRGQFSAGLEQFTTALKNPLYSTPYMAYLNAGICSHKAGNAQQADAYLRKALELQPELPGAFRELASLSFDGGNYVEADKYFSRYAKDARDAMSAQDLLLGTRIAHKTGNSEAAQDYSLQLGKRFPDSPEFKQMQQER
jgi:type IV pilus assembly protein PilF